MQKIVMQFDEAIQKVDDYFQQHPLAVVLFDIRDMELCVDNRLAPFGLLSFNGKEHILYELIKVLSDKYTLRYDGSFKISYL